jgi:hypothetical protein
LKPLSFIHISKDKTRQDNKKPDKSMSFARLTRLQRLTSSSSVNIHRLSKANISVIGLGDPKDCYEVVRRRDPNQPEFLQAVDEVI